jgi:hypothetical protein
LDAGWCPFAADSQAERVDLGQPSVSTVMAEGAGPLDGGTVGAPDEGLPHWHHRLGGGRYDRSPPGQPSDLVWFMFGVFDFQHSGLSVRYCCVVVLGGGCEGGMI